MKQWKGGLSPSRSEEGTSSVTKSSQKPEKRATSLQDLRRFPSGAAVADSHQLKWRKRPLYSKSVVATEVYLNRKKVVIEEVYMLLGGRERKLREGKGREGKGMEREKRGKEGKETSRERDEF